MALAIFDLDETLVNGDCSSRWMQFMVERGLADSEAILAEEARLMEDYYRGELDMHAYMAMMLRPLIGMSRTDLDALVAQYVDQCIRPHMREAALALIAEIHQRGDQPLVISASPEFIVAPVARAMGIEQVLGVDIALDEQGRITGEIDGVMTYQQGKVVRLVDWLGQNDASLEGSAFYSDSHNDLPLLEAVEFPVAVTPDSQLNQLALERGWPVLQWQ